MKKLVISFTLVCCAAFAAAEIKELPHSISAELDGKVLWTYNHDPAEGKPYFHPLSSSGGILFTDLRPKDHPWHRGVWFSWKFINGVNYWEENRSTGKSDGETRIIGVARKVMDGQEVHLEIDLEYAPAGSDAVVMKERRKVVVSAPDNEGVYAIDWSSTFQALENDVVLDRTPLPEQPKGKKWGGYAGWSVRMNAAMKGSTFLGSEGQGDVHRQTASWMLFNSPDNGSLLFMDHPDNFSYPSTWYVAANMPYFSPAIIHDAPHTIKAGTSLKLKYRLVVLPEPATRETAVACWKKWRSLP
jgi:hypothetical protein